jgi:hypothetical protein
MYRLLGRHYNIQYNLEHFLMSKFQMTASNAQEAINFLIGKNLSKPKWRPSATRSI